MYVPPGSTTMPSVAQSPAHDTALSPQSHLPLPQAFGTPLHVPVAHMSLDVHAFPSSQFAVLFACWQPTASHESVVQTLPSSQFVAVVCTQVPFGSQLSAVHALPSSQFLLEPVQVPPVQTSPVVQALPSLQAMPFGFKGLLHPWPLQVPAK